MIWKALADPTRRSILSMLRQSPLTTGEISDRIDDLSRYAVMKHLGILEDAQLISTRKEGKYRWNYLNAAPLQKSYEHWLRHLVQIARQTTPTMGAARKFMTATFSIEQTLTAPTGKVWAALTAELSSWWPRNLLYYHGSSLIQRETGIGGRLYEQSGPDDGYLWAHVIGLEREKYLMLKGQLIPQMGGPAISFLHFELERAAKRTCRLNFSCTLFGDFKEKTADEQRENWERLIKKALNDHLTRAN